MLVSIITVNFNHLEGLKRTYESIVSQTFTDYEWIVIDGGSTDGSREFIEQHQDRFAYWCSEKDNGIYHAMNKGIRQAKGEYLNFMNSGDTFACSKTLAGVFSEQRTADILYGYMMCGHINGSYYHYYLMESSLHWSILFSNTLPHQASFIKRSLFDVVGMYDESLRVASDAKWFKKAILHYRASCECIPKKIAIFEGEGLSAKDNYIDEVVHVQKDIFPDYVCVEDVRELRRVSIIKSSKFTALLYRAVTIMAILLFRLKRAWKDRKLSEHFN